MKPMKKRLLSLLLTLVTILSLLPTAAFAASNTGSGLKITTIAAMEGITPSQAGKSIHAALRRLRRYFARQKWTVNL